MTVIIGICGVVVVLALCAWLLVELHRGSTRLSPWERAVLNAERARAFRPLTFEEQLAVAFAPIRLAVDQIAPLARYYVEAFRPTLEAFRKQGLIK